MLLGVGHQDQVGFVLSQNQLYPPGTQYIYSTGYAAVASAVAKAALKPNDGPDAFWTQFFDKIGMSRVTFEEDPQGHPLGGSYVYATVRDYAKFGYLYLNDGCWAGERILPENWVAQSTTISDVYKFNHSDSIPNGYMWWVNQPPVAGAALPFKDVPADMYTAIGHWGQYVTVVPSADVVVVRTGDDRKGCPANAVDGKVDGVSCGFDLNTFVSLALQVAK
jgi:CubicO group peptidase (beta-lactamase class C family)